MDRTEASHGTKFNYQVKNRLNTSNWFLYQREIFSNYLPVFGEAGNELRNNKPFDLTEEPLRTELVHDRYINAQGEIVTSVKGRQWSAEIDGPDYAREKIKWEKRLDQLKSDKRQLWFLLMSSLSVPIYERVTSSPNFAQLTANGEIDTLGLWRLIQGTVMTHGTNTGPLIRQKWHALRQEDPSTGKVLSLRDLLIEFDGHISLLKGTTSEPTDADQVHQLVTALKKGRYDFVTTGIHTGVRTYLYKDLKEALLKLEEYGSLPALGTTNTDGDHHLRESAMYSNVPMNGKDKNKRNPGENRGRTVYPTDDKNKKRGFDNRNSTPPRTNTAKTNPQCGNCGKFHTGKCLKEPVTCTWCCNKWHGEDFCEQKKRDVQAGITREVRQRENREKWNNKSRNGHNGRNNNSGKRVRFNASNASLMNNSHEEPQAFSRNTYEEWTDDDCFNAFSGTLRAHTKTVNHKTAQPEMLLLDSGASITIFPNQGYIPKGHLDTVTPIQDTTNMRVVGINGVELTPTAKGNLPGIGRYLIVPRAACPLLSMTEIAKNGDYSFTITDNKCRITHKTLDIVPALTLNSDRSNGFYVSKGQFNQLVRVTYLAQQATIEDYDIERSESDPTSIYPGVYFRDTAYPVTVTDTVTPQDDVMMKPTATEAIPEHSGPPDAMVIVGQQDNEGQFHPPNPPTYRSTMTATPTTTMPTPVQSVVPPSNQSVSLNLPTVNTVVNALVDATPTVPTRTTPFNQKTYSKEQIQRSHEVRSLHNLLSHPSDKTLINALNNGLIIGTRLTAQDVRNYKDILGPCIHCIAGKTVKPSYPTNSKTPPADCVGSVVHVDIYELSEVTVGGNKFCLFCVDEYSGFLSSVNLSNKSTQSLEQGFYTLIGSYKAHNHTIHTISTDSETNLTACAPFLGHHGITLHQSPPYQHSQRVERYVRTVKDRIRTILDSLPYELPPKLYGELLQHVIFWLNALPNSLHPNHSPSILLTGQKLDLNYRLNSTFGQLAMLHSPDKPHKLQPRADLGIILGPSSTSYNTVRAYVFNTQRIKIRNKFTPITQIPHNFEWPVKNRQSHPTKPDNLTNILSKSSVIPPKLPTNLTHHPKPPHTTTITSQQKASLERGNEGIKSHTNLYPHNTSQLKPLTTEKVTNTLPLPSLPLPLTPLPLPVTPLPLTPLPLPPTPLSSPLTPLPVPLPPNDPSSSSHITEDITTAQTHTPQVNNSDITIDGINTNNNQRPKRKAAMLNYTHGRPEYRTNDDKSSNEQQTKQTKHEHITSKTTHKAMRLSVKQALNGEYKTETRKSVIDEIMNMLEYNVGRYIRSEDIPYEYKQNVIRSFMFIKHKMKADGTYDKTKARLVGNGKGQNQNTFDVISSSTVAIQAVMLLLNIASNLKATVSSYDVKGAFLNAKYDETQPTYMVIDRDTAQIWAQLDPSAKSFMNEKGELILTLDKYIYGLKQSPLKFQLHLQSTLMSLGYKQCLHDTCMYVKHQGSDISILSTHVDDILQASTSDNLTKELHAKLVEVYKSITFNERAESYLGMTISQSQDNSIITLSQQGYLDKLLKQHANMMEKHKPHKQPTTSASNDLFENPEEEQEETVDDNNNNNGNTTTSSKEDRNKYLSIIMGLMYLARLTRADILLPTTYLATRCHIANTADWKKLARVLWYLDGTRNKTINIECNELTLNAYCDASYGIHSDGKSHTGFWITMGTMDSMVTTKSSKQKLTATSSTDAEILAVVEVVKTIMWLQDLAVELIGPNLGQNLRHSTVYQDNKSAICLMTDRNGKTKRSRHLLIKISYIKDCMLLGRINFVYKPTEEMIADVLTKPLQGNIFTKFIDSLFNKTEKNWENSYS